MGITKNRATQRAFCLLKERFANGFGSRPGASERDFGVCLALQRFSKRPLLRQFGWYHGVVFVPTSFLWQGWRLFLFSAVSTTHKQLFN